MKKILTLLAFCVNFSFCFGQDEIKDSTFLTTIELDNVVVKGHETSAKLLV